MQKYAVIVAGGSGQRMGSTLPKQFLLLKGKPVLWHTLYCFLKAYTDLNIVLVLPSSYLSDSHDWMNDLPGKERIQLVAGGDTRFASVKNGFAFIKEPSVVFVHDGVRCLVSDTLIHRCYEQTLQLGSAIPAVAATDSIRIVAGTSHQVVDRNMVRIIQTPQTFLSQLLLPAFEQHYQESFTDEATVVEASGQKVFLIEGDYNNLKITRPMDLLMAEKILES